MAAEMSTYPVRFDVQHPEAMSRWLIFVKWLLVIPHFLILYALGGLQAIITVIAFFAIIFTRRFPPGLFDLLVKATRWNANVSGYVLLMRDEYPPFTWEPGQYPVTFEVDYPAQMSRWLPLVKWLLVIPHMIILGALSVVAGIAVIIAWFAILFTRRYPRGLFDFILGVTRWTYRLAAYMYLMRDEYPPFSLS